MRIGLTGWSRSVDGIVAQAQQAEADGFSSLWLASPVCGDPMVPIAVAGRATERIELGTAVLQTYPVHPLLQANRAASVADAMGRSGFTLGIGPSHAPVVEGVFGYSYERPGRNTEEYLRILCGVLRGEVVDLDGEEWSAHTEGRGVAPKHPVPVLLAALGPRLLRVAGEVADGVVLWMASAKALETHVMPTLLKASDAAGRPRPRVVAGLPVCVHDDVGEARQGAAAASTMYADSENYQRILEIGGAATPADVAVVGDEASVERQLRALLGAGATDVWASPFPAGPDPRGSLRRTHELLRSLAVAR